MINIKSYYIGWDKALENPFQQLTIDVPTIGKIELRDSILNADTLDLLKRDLELYAKNILKNAIYEKEEQI